MKKIISYLKQYCAGITPQVWVSAILFIAIFIFCNYYYGLNRNINRLSLPFAYAAWYFIFLSTLIFGYAIAVYGTNKPYFKQRSFNTLLIIAPAIFAWKIAVPVSFHLSPHYFINSYWNHLLYWPFKLVVITVCLMLLWKLYSSGQPFYGTSTKNFNAQPYGLMLLLMVPLIAWASTQPDFLATYPKLKNISHLPGATKWYNILLFELAYGSDFITIELFFRGFLVLAFAQWAGKDAVLPMALFYCTIHFGKPLGECISSFFGGIILGVVTLRTGNIWGGLIVHLGIAWLMEAGGVLGHYFNQ